VVPTGFVVVMRAEALAGNQLILPVAIDVGPLQIVILRVVGVYRVLYPEAVSVRISPLLQPVQPIAMRLPDNEIVEPVAVHILDQNGNAGAAKIEITMQRPDTAVRIFRSL